MENIQAYQILLVVCSVVILSYLFSIVSRITRIPSVLMLLAIGVGIQQALRWYHIDLKIPHLLIEILGTIGLIMIVLEASLDLEVNKEKLPLIKSSFLSAFIILLFSTVGIAWIFQAFVHLSWYQSFLYALPFTTVSSAIVLPSVAHLMPNKKEFLIYEASFSDIVGILFFNFLAAGSAITFGSVFWLFGSVFSGILVSFLVSVVLIFLLMNHKSTVRFFLTFAVLILVYVVGKMLNQPSLITILLFGLVVNNWRLFDFEIVQKQFPTSTVVQMADFLKSITAETSFLIRTFFFIIFGMSIDLSCFSDIEALKIGGMVMLALIITRFVYLRVLNNENLFPEVLYSPRGLISVLLFYKIPDYFIDPNFKTGILVIVIVASNVLMMIGALLYRKPVIEG
jgi:Kef-type K+ transport system membrane component KefB